MALKSDHDSKTICKKLMLLLPGFYLIYYLVSRLQQQQLHVQQVHQLTTGIVLRRQVWRSQAF
jgi:hypothetical protein